MLLCEPAVNGKLIQRSGRAAPHGSAVNDSIQNHFKSVRTVFISLPGTWEPCRRAFGRKAPSRHTKGLADYNPRVTVPSDVWANVKSGALFSAAGVVANEAAVPLSGQNRSLRSSSRILAAHGRTSFLPSPSWRFSRCRFPGRYSAPTWLCIRVVKVLGLPLSGGAKISEDRLYDFFAFIGQVFKHLLQDLSLRTGKAVSLTPLGIQKIYPASSSRFRTQVIVQRQNFYIVINRLPRDLKAFSQLSGPDLSSLAKDLDDGFSAPICVHILSPPHFLLQIHHTRILSKNPLPFPRKI